MYEEAETMHRETLELIKKVLGSVHPYTLASMNNLAEVLNSQGAYANTDTHMSDSVKYEDCNFSLLLLSLFCP